MKTEQIIQIFIDDLVLEEQEKMGAQLSDDYQKNCNEIKKSCEVFGDTIAITIYDYFESFYKLVEEAPSMLDPEKVLQEFKIVKNKGENLRDFIDKEVESPEELDTFLEEYKLTIENRLSAIEKEQENRKANLEAAIAKNIYLENINGSEELVLNIHHHVQPLIGMNGLLNYQIKQMVETNELIYKKLLEEAKKHDKKVVYIKDKNSDELTEEKKAEFLEYVAEDKDIILDYSQNSDPDDESKQAALEISEELACNLVYKICWEAELNIEIAP